MISATASDEGLTLRFSDGHTEYWTWHELEGPLVNLLGSAIKL